MPVSRLGTFLSGTYVISRDASSRRGIAFCCSSPRSETHPVGVIWEDGNGLVEHVPSGTLAELTTLENERIANLNAVRDRSSSAAGEGPTYTWTASPWAVPTDRIASGTISADRLVNYAMSAERMSEALGITGMAAQTVRENLNAMSGRIAIQENVGTPNNENEGEEMPNATTEVEVDTIQVPHSAESLEELFLSMNTPQVLMRGLDPETWEAHRQELMSAVHDIPWDVRRGSFTMDYPTIRISGHNVRIRSTPLSVAQEFLNSASNGRLSLVPAGDTNKYRMKAISDLEDSAWTLYGGAGLSLYTEVVNAGDPETIDLRNLASIMGEFSSFMHSRDHRAYLRSAIRERMNGNKPSASPDPKVWNTQRVDQFQKFLKGVKSRLQPEDNPFSKLPILPHKTLSSRTWGIEIEAVDIEGVKTPEYWQLKNDGSLRNLGVASFPSKTKPAEVGTPNSEASHVPPSEPDFEDHEDGCSSWNEDEDTGDNYPCDCGYVDAWDEYSRVYREYVAAHGDPYSSQNIRSHTGEWNSPVLRSYHSRGLKYLTDEIEPRNTNDSAGVHVHVGAKDLSPEQAIQVSMIYTALEPLFESAYMRGNTRSYCKSPDVAELITRFNAMRKAKKSGIKATDMQFSSRYWTVNLAALSSHKTIEFRAMGSVYNYDHLVRWAYFCRELVNIAKANVPQSAWTKVRTMEDVVTLFAKYGKETPTPEWAATELATDIVEALGSENRRLPQSARLESGNNRSPLLVNDDYTAAQTYFLGERPSVAEEAGAFSYSF